MTVRYNQPARPADSRIPRRMHTVLRIHPALRRAALLCLCALFLQGSASQPAAAAPADAAWTSLPDVIALSPGEGTYTFSPEELMYLSGIKALSSMPDLCYSLADTDGDDISELFLKDGKGTISVYQYDPSVLQAKICKGGKIPDDLAWVGNDQWADGSIIGVARQTGDPGVRNDYYLSANYDWLTGEHIQTDGDPRSATGDIEVRVHERQEEMFTDTEKYQGEDIQRLRDYYALASNWDRRSKDGIEPVKKYLDAVNSVSSLSELTDYLSDPEKDPFCIMLNFTVTLDLGDTSHWALDLTEDPTFSMVTRVYHTSTKEEIAAAREDYERVVGHILTRAGYSEETVKQILADCFELEDALLPLAWMEDENEEPFVPFDEVTASCKNFPLEKLLNAYGITGGNIRVYFPEYLKQLDALYTEENLPKLKAYLTAHTAAVASQFLDEEAAGSLLGEQIDPESLNSDCKRELLSPRGLFSVAEENAYMTFFAPDDVREDVTKMAEDIRSTFRKMLQTEDWLSEAGRNAALEKLDNMTFCILRPDTLIDSSYLAVDPEGCYLDEYAKVSVNVKKHNGSFTGKEREKGDWRYDLRPDLSSSYTNAFYFSTFNQFFILAGFVDDSVYTVDMSEEEKLAKLGEIVGHELTHGFDPDGIQYDKSGNKVGTEENPRGWLPEEDFAAFQKRAKRVADYFDGIRPFPYDKCSGEHVQSEAIADMGGLTIGLKIAAGIEDFDYDRFFRLHAQLWNLQTSLEQERSEIYNEHPLSHLRINVTVQQAQEFYDTYNVKEGDQMYLAPDDRILVW